MIIMVVEIIFIFCFKIWRQIFMFSYWLLIDFFFVINLICGICTLLVCVCVFVAYKLWFWCNAWRLLAWFYRYFFLMIWNFFFQSNFVVFFCLFFITTTTTTNATNSDIQINRIEQIDVIGFLFVCMNSTHTHKHTYRPIHGNDHLGKF